MLKAHVDPLILPLLADVEGFGRGITAGGGGADIGPMMRDGVPGMSVQTDNRSYFNVPPHAGRHRRQAGPGPHGAVRPPRLAVLAYVAAEMPERLPARRG